MCLMKLQEVKKRLDMSVKQLVVSQGENIVKTDEVYDRIEKMLEGTVQKCCRKTRQGGDNLVMR